MPKVIRGKLIIVGDSSVGKSSLAQAFHSDGQTITKNYTMTTGVEILTKNVTLSENGNHIVETFIYDCAGKEIFSDLVVRYIDHPNMIMLVYDVTNENSLNSCARWLERMRAIKPDCHIPTVLVANKIDLDQRRIVSSKAGSIFAQQHSIAYVECSAKENQFVENPFLQLCKEYFHMYQQTLLDFKDLA